MPRIDPLKLLTCLKVLLASNGGIRSENEVKRLAGLMTKYSKKLVSKCIYIQILKCTNTELLGEFMGSGGWTLTHMWLSDGIHSRNWPLVQEILELLLLCPVDTQRLRSNTAPKLVKTLCQTGGNEGVRILAAKLVEQWLKVVKEESVSNAQTNNQISNPSSTVVGNVRSTDVSLESRTSSVNNTTAIEEHNPVSTVGKTAIEEDPLAIPTTNAGSSLKTFPSPISQRSNNENTLVYQIVMKDGKQVLAKIENSTNSSVADNADKLYDEESNKNENKLLEDQLKDASNKENEKHKKEQDGKEDKESSKDKDKSRSSKDKDKDKNRDSKSSHRTSSSKSKSSSSSKSKSSSSHRSSTDSKNRDRETDRSDSDRDKDKSRSSSSKSSSSKDRHKDRDKDKSKEREKSKTKDKEKEDDSERYVPSKIALPSIDKLGKIPKKPKDDTKPAPTSITIPSKKASISIEFRRDADRPKTVKTYKSQFRSHGLSEEAPPPPSRKGLKKPSSQTVPGTSIPPNISSLNLTLKRSSPPPQPVSPGSSPSASTKDAAAPVEKKLKLDIIGQTTGVEKQGGIKLIPIKPKPPTLVESDLFMDALSASAVFKKDAKKRKRRPSASKEATKEPNASSPPQSPMDTSPASKLTPLKFYQDTLEEKDDEKIESSEESKEDKDEKREDEDDIPLKKVKESIDEKVRQEKEEEELRRELEDETSEPVKKPPGPGCGPDGPPGVLMMHRRKGPKKKLSWRSQEDLEEVRYFELDETERVNVTKTFTDMKQMERFNEREAFMMARKLNCEDLMNEQTSWTPLVLVDDVPPHPEGNSSREKKIQAERELTTLKALYFNRHMIPDSASEPDMDMEQYQKTEPAVIPLDDITGNPDAVNDFTNMPWPEPKGSPPSGIPDEFNAVKNAPMPNPPFNPFMQFGQPGWPMGGPGGPGGMVPPGGPGGPMGPGGPGMPPNNMLPPPIMGGPMGGPMGGFNNMNMGPPNMNMGPPNMMMDHDEMGMNNMNMMQPPFHPPGPNFGGPPNNFNNFAPHHPPPMNMEMGPPPNINNGPRGSNRVGGNWRSGAPGPPPVNNNNPGNWRPQGPPVNNRNNWVHGNPRICKQFQRGFCRNGNKCNFIHAPANKNY